VVGWGCEAMLMCVCDRPVEISQVNIVPADFFTCNPSIDVPSSKNDASLLANGCGDCGEEGKSKL